MKKKKDSWVVYNQEIDGDWFNPHFWDSDGDGGPERYRSPRQAGMSGYRLRKVTKNVYSLHSGEKIVGLLIKK